MKKEIGPMFCVTFTNHETVFHIKDVLLVELLDKDEDISVVQVTFHNNMVRRFKWSDKKGVIQMYLDLKQAMAEYV